MINPKETESSYRFLTEAAMKALQEDGWSISKSTGHGRANVWNINKNGKSGRVSIRTTRDRWIAYQPLKKGSSWKTLGEVDFVCVSAFVYNEKSEGPIGVNVHLIDASIVKEAFNQNYSARVSEGHTVTDNFGMWVCIDQCSGTQAAHVGSGFATEKNLIANYPLDSLIAASTDQAANLPQVQQASHSKPVSVSDILDQARIDISKITGIPVEGVSLDLHLKA
ncbi:hypothetical protein ACFOM8_22620 [Paracoccus angustae]|uniref:Uncharacterized protein n=1 Tax=Paracoccus angustae TaxID=1671480 RepID=A0ABV7UAP6_9RHOB